MDGKIPIKSKSTVIFSRSLDYRVHTYIAFPAPDNVSAPNKLSLKMNYRDQQA